MKRVLFLSSLILMICSCTVETVAPRISIFCDHVETIASQEGITFAEAAALVREIGYTGIDVRVGMPEEKFRVLDSLGFEHACAIVSIDFTAGDQEQACKETQDWLAEHGQPRLLVIPGLLHEGETFEETAARIAAFASSSAEIGQWVMVEDFDTRTSPCFNIEGLTRLFAASEDLGHVMDTGNYIVAGDDCLEALELFKDRVGHVHLKDRRAADDLSCPAVGTGCIPVREVIATLVQNGYDGWFTVEHFGSKNMLEDARASYENVKAAIEAAL